MSAAKGPARTQGAGRNPRAHERLSAQALALAEMNQEALFLVWAASGEIADTNPLAGRRLGKGREELVGRALGETLNFPDLDRLLGTLSPGRPVRWAQRLSLSTDGAARLWDIQVIRLGEGEGASALVSLRPESEAEASSTLRLQQSLQKVSAALDEEPDSGTGPSLLEVCVGLAQATLGALYLRTPQGEFARQGVSPQAASAPDSLQAREVGSAQAFLAWKLGEPTPTPLLRWAGANGLRQLAIQPLRLQANPGGVLLLGWTEMDPPHDLPFQLLLSATVLEAWMRAQDSHQERDRAGAELARSDSISRALLDELPHAILVVQSPEGRISEANPSAEEIFEYSTKELGAARLDEWLTAPEAVVAVRAAGESGRIQEVNELTLYRRRGEAFPALLRAVPLGAPSAQALREVLVIITDLTSSQEARLEAQHMQRQAVLGWLAASFAHEVRNPLNNLTLQLGEMGALHTLTPELAELVKEAQNECRRLSEISRRMLDFARGQDFHLVPTDMVALVNRILLRMRPTLERAGIQSHLATSEALPLAQADPLSIEQVIINLVDNAAKAMPSGGHLAITVEARALASGETGIEVRVADTGQGLPAQVRENLFQPYVTTRADGHGLGLALSRHILDAHRGTLQVESYPGSGTVFRICIPAEAEAEA